MSMTTELSAARIFTPQPQQAPDSGWSWRSSWYSGSESIYAVLAKFAALNRIKPRELCELLVEPTGAARYKMVGKPHFPKVDLRFSTDIRYGRLANILKIDADQLRKGFVSEQFPHAIGLASPDLIWCPQCAQRGYHCASFQLNFYRRCPLHKTELRRVCSKCHRPLPYWLYPPQSVGFFICPNCGLNHAQRLQELRVNLMLAEDECSLFADHVELVSLVDSLPTLVNAQRTLMGAPHLPIVISKADALRRRAHFHQFVTSMLASVAARRGLPQAHLDISDPMVAYSEPYLPMEKILMTSRVKSNSEEIQADALVVYRSLRRWIGRRVLCGHRHCVAEAQRHLWWNTEGETTTAFCPVAIAFLRWRMQWEGCRIPAALDQQRRLRTLYGLIGWVYSEAPIPSVLWTEGLTRWLTKHLLGFACLDSFYGWLDSANRSEATGRIFWSHEECRNFNFRHWACSGRGTQDEPGLLYVEMPRDTRELTSLAACSRNHRTRNLAALGSIHR